MFPESIVALFPSDTPRLTYRFVVTSLARDPSLETTLIAYEVERDDLGNGSALIHYRYRARARAASLRDDLARLDPEGEAA